MNSIYIASGIILLLIILVSYAFIAQTLEKRRKHRQRLLMALKHRQRDFKFMISGFPPGFLTPDLTMLVYHALLDCCEQLSKLEPRNSNHREDIQLYSNQLEALRTKGGPPRGRLENPHLASEIRRQLQELHRFVLLQLERGNLSRVQATTYSEQIKQLALQMSVDASVLQAKAAETAGKSRLALHHYTMARKLLLRENTGPNHQQQIAQFSEIITKLEEQLAAQAQASGDKTAPPAADKPSKEWEKFDERELGWKKKQIYD